jgi:prepilin peptidase CpaA
MAPGLDRMALAGFAALMIAAAVIDFRRLVIPNTLVIALCALWPLHAGSLRGAGLLVAVESIAVAALVLVAGSALFARGLVGGGDVKLLAAACLWTGAAGVPRLLLGTALIGGVLALMFLTPLARLSGAGRRLDELQQDQAAGAGSAPIPYGVAIAAASLIVTLPPYLNCHPI